MLAALGLSLALVVIHVMIKQGRWQCYGYNYGSVVCDGEWWRLVVAAMCHEEQSHLLLSVFALSWVSDVSNFAYGSIILCLGTEIASLCFVGLAVRGGASRIEFAAGPREQRDDHRWLAHGCSALAVAWITKEPRDLPRPALVALLLSFSVQLLAPSEPVLPLAAAWLTGSLVGRIPSLDAALDSVYWTNTMLFWVLFAALASLKATRPAARVPGFGYSHFPASSWHADEEDVPELAPDGAPIFRISHPDDDYVEDPLPPYTVAQADWPDASDGLFNLPAFDGDLPGFDPRVIDSSADYLPRPTVRDDDDIFDDDDGVIFRSVRHMAHTP